MNKDDIRHFAVTGSENGKFCIQVKFPQQAPYYLMIGSCNPNVNRGLKPHLSVVPVSARTPNMQDMRVLRYLNPENLPESLTGVTILASSTNGLKASCTIFNYRSSSEFLHDLELCDNDIGRMLSNTGNFRLIQK